MRKKLEPADREEWLIISHAFNMDGRAASLTITDKIPFLKDQGVDPIVISGILGSRDAHIKHYKLLPAGPSGLRFDLRHLIRRRTDSKMLYNLTVGLVSLILFPFSIVERLLTGLSGQASWGISAFLVARSLISRRAISVIYTTGGAYSAHLAGYWLKRYLGCRITWLAEIHDPMVASGLIPKNREERLLARLESKIAQGADLVWWFTKGARDSACERHSEFIHKSFWVLPGASPVSSNQSVGQQGKLTFGHFGSLTENRSLNTFMIALDRWLSQNPRYRAITQVHLYGGSADRFTLRVIKATGLTDIVRIHSRTERASDTGKSGRQQIQEKMCNMTCLLIPHGTGGDCAEYIPSKFYDYLWARRPIFVLSTGNPQFEQLLKERNGWFVNSHDIDQIVQAISEFANLWKANQLDSRWIHEPISTKYCVATILDKLNKIR